MKQFFTALGLLAMFGTWISSDVLAQCTNTQLGGQSGCARSATYYGEILPNFGCGNFTSVASYSPGTYFRIPVLNGACYSVSTCGASTDTQINAFQGNATTGPFAYDDDSGPICTGLNASLNMVPNFTDYARIDVREYACLPGGSASFTVNVRQNNNLAFTSPGTDMCAGEVRALTATPTPVTPGSSMPGSGDEGTFTGTGVSGATFTAPTPAGSSAIYTITYTFGYCSTTQNITVYRPATVANAGPNLNVCASSATLAANTPIYGTGTWTVVSGPGIVATPSSPTSVVNGLSSVTPTVLRWTITNGPCASSQDDVIISASATPTVANAGTDQTVCASTATLAGNTALVGTGNWTLVGGTGTITTPGSPTSGVTGLGVGSNTFRWTISNGSCPPSSDDVVIIRDQVPTTANAGPDQTVCTSTATLAGNAAAVGSGTWTLISGAGTITTPSSPTSGITGLGLGANTFRWTIANGTCTSSTDDVVITRETAPTTANAGPDQILCSATATLAGNTPSVGTGTWTLVGGTGTITTPSSPTSGITGLGVGTNTFRWTISNGTCTSSTDDVVITRDAVPTTSNAGPDQAICASTATLAGNSPAVGSGTWTLISGAGTITTPSSPTSGLTGLGVGANTFRWTISNGSCTSSTDDVVITVSAAPTTANAGSDQVICASTATLAGNTPTTGTGTWTLISGTGTITTPSSPTSGLTGLSVGANTFRWTISNGSCTSSTDDVVITVSAAPTTSNAGSDQAICATTATLAGNTPTVGTGIWTLISGTGTITTPSSPTSGLTGLGVGANTFRWTISNGSCVASTDDVVITVSAQPTTSNAGADQAVCGSSATLAGNTPSVGTGTWTLISGTGTITTPSSPTSGLTGLGVGANTFRWTISNGSCTSSTDDVVITVSAGPTTALAGPDQTVCATTATLAGNTPTVGTGTWTLVSGAGTITTPSSPTSGITGLAIGANTFRWTIANGSCADSFDDVVITRDEQPTTSIAGPDQVINCIDYATLGANIPAVGVGAWSVISGSGTFVSTSDPATVINTLGVGANTLEWTISNGVCPPATDQVVITVNPDVTAPDVPILLDLSDECSVTAVAPTTTDNCAGTVTGTTSDPLTYSSEGVYYINWTFDDGNGNTSSTTQTVIIDDATAPMADVAILSDIVADCEVTSLTAPTATDNCVGPVTATSDAILPITAAGTTVVTWTYDDGNGNISTQTQNVIVNTVDASVTQTGGTLTANGAGVGYTYQWLDCDNAYAVIPGATGQSFSPTSVTGSYAVEVSNGVCTDTSECIFLDVTGIEEIGLSLNYQIYPNPNTGDFTLKVENLNGEMLSLEIVDAAGRLVYATASEQTTGTFERHVDIRGEGNGTYYLRIYLNGKVAEILSFVKEQH